MLADRDAKSTVNTENKVPKLENPRQSKSNPLPDAEKSDDATMRVRNLPKPPGKN